MIYDSRNEFYKSPYGAVRSGTAVTFRALIRCEADPFPVRLYVHYDRHQDPALYEMTPVEDAWRDDAPVPETINLSLYTLYSVTVTIEDSGLYWYHFELDTPEGLQLAGRNPADNRCIITPAPENWQLTVYKPQYAAPKWIYGGVYYHIFVDRFHRSEQRTIPAEDPPVSWHTLPGKRYHRSWEEEPDWMQEDGEIYNRDFFGGDLAGITEKLPYLQDLGVNCLYLSPIFQAYSNHKYDTGDYSQIDEMFGSEEDFRQLCNRAGELGMRVVLDGVFAHTGADSIYFDRYDHYHSNGAWTGPDSPYRDWFFFREDGSYASWWGIETLPRLNKSNPRYTEFICGPDGIVRRWLAAGASGWRLDVADELDTSFIKNLAAAAKREKEDALIVGEVWEDASHKIAYNERKNYFEGDKLDTVMNYPFRTGLIDYVRDGQAEALAATVEQLCENYPPFALHSLMNLLGTHDSMRILTALAGKDLGPSPTREMEARTHMTPEELERGISLLKLAAALQMTLPGVPCVYYGDEVGLEGYLDPFNRRPFPWGRENKSLLDWYRKLIHLRREHDVYKEGRYQTLLAEDGLFAFERFDDEHSIITAANRSTEAFTLELDGPAVDLLSDQRYDSSVIIAPGEVMILDMI